MRLLVLGGTRFVGRALTAAALAGGHEVTLFHRGRTNPELFPEAEHLHGDRDGDLGLLAGRHWDACVDVSGYLPRVVRASSELLRNAVDRMVFVSTISVYADLAAPRDESSPLATLDDESVEEITGETYGGLKALCEGVVEDTFGSRATVVRPGFVVGPHDHTGRFAWWVLRAARGGTMPVPTSINARMQFIDARDLAGFLLHVVEGSRPGTFNATGPVPPIGMSDVLETTARVADVDLRLVPVDDGAVSAAGIEYPLWSDDPRWAALAEVDVSRALAAGLTFRPLSETVRAALYTGAVVDDVGPTADDEALLL